MNKIELMFIYILFRFFHMIFEEEIGRVKGHFGPINNLKFHPSGKRLAEI